MTWQPISTAPKDGTQVLVAWLSANRRGWMIRVSHFNGEHWSCRKYPWLPGPTQWRPLPEPPAAEEAAA